MASAALRDLYEIDIPAQSADLALIEFAEQTDQTLIFSFVDTKDVKVTSVSGLLSTQDALTRMLTTTGLSFSITEDGVYTIKTLVEGENMKIKSKVGLIGALAAAFTASAAVQGQDASANTIEEVVVTGSNIQRSGFAAVSPVQVVNREDMLAEGAKTITDFAINLPVNVGSEFQTESGALIGTAQFNLRGLGLGST